MKQFTDKQGRSWTIDLSTVAFKRIKSLTGLDMLAKQNGDVFLTLSADPELLVNAIYAACKPQIDAKGLTDEQFAESLGGESLEAALAGLLSEYCDFFLNPADRKNLRDLLEKTNKAIDAAGRVIGERVKQLDPETEIKRSGQR